MIGIPDYRRCTEVIILVRHVSGEMKFVEQDTKKEPYQFERRWRVV